MILEIDHVLVVAPDPEAAAADLAAVLGLLPAGGGVHESIGTRNALLSLGGPYLELIGLLDGATATRGRALRHPIGAAVVRALEALAAGDAVARDDQAGTIDPPARYAYVTAALRSDDVAGDLARLASGGRAVGMAASEVVRHRPDGTAIRWSVALPPRLGPDEPPFLIEHAPDEPERATRVAAGGPRLRGASIVVADPAAAARGWADAWGLPAVARLPEDRSPDDPPPAPAPGDPPVAPSLALRVGTHRMELVAAAGVAATTGAAVIRLIGAGRAAPRIVRRGGVVFRID